MDDKTKAKMSYYWQRFKANVANGAKSFANGVKTTFNNAKNSIESSIAKVKLEKQIKYDNEVQRYRTFVKETLESLDDLAIKNFFNDLGESKSELTYKSVTKYKHSFPIPKEQPILWACVSYDTNRIGGIIVTKNGIYTKSLVNVFTENALNKENRKVSELFYYPWEFFNPDIFIDGEATKDLGSVDKEGLNNFINACKRYLDGYHNQKLKSYYYYQHKEDAINGSVAAVGSSLLKNELKFTRDNGAGNSNTGHGLFAEKANNMNDLLHFKNARLVGGDNVKNGADRIVNGVRYQTKYYKTGARSVGAAFDGKDGLYRYMNPDGTPMKLEVPKGQHDAAVEALKNKIIQGKVPGVTNPSEAENIIVEGHYTYEQAVNISKPGTIESLSYDIKTGAVATTCIFGISFLINAFLSFRKTHDLKKASVDGLIAGGKCGALALSTHVLVSQLSRTHTFSQIMTKNLILNGVVGASAGFVIFSIPETYKFALKKISGSQYASNLTVLSASIIGGTVGAYVGGATLGPVGAVAGGVGLGSAVGVGASKIMNIFFEGDDQRYSRLFNAYSTLLMSEYLLDEAEIDKFISKMNTVSDAEFKKLFQNLNSSSSQENTIRNFLKPYFDEIVNCREVLRLEYSFENA